MRFLGLLWVLVYCSFALADESVKVKAHRDGAYIVVDGRNDNPFSVTVAYDASYMNLQSARSLPLLFVLKPHSRKEVLRLKILKAKFAYKAHYDWTIGSKDAKHDESYIYRLPYQLGTKEMVSQGFNGTFSHQGKSQYAIDFNLKEGTKIYAAREGMVVLIKEDSNTGGANRSYEKDANFIVIEHRDGTLAKYAHLQKDGVVVEVGQSIERGELIGYSGKTGFARGAHLHFIVYKALNGKTRQSFPIKFKAARGIVDLPQKGEFYTSVK